MMPAVQQQADLVARLPAVRGRYRACVTIAELVWFRVGGPAEVVFRPADRDDLAHFRRNRPSDVPVIAIGVGSNLLVRDGGLDGVVVRLGRGLSEIAVDGELVRVGAGALDTNVALTALQHDLAGLEFLIGIPGTIGGGLRMNAGAYGGEIAEVLVQAEAVDGEGRVHTVGPQDLGFRYRTCAAPEDWIFTSAVLRGSKGERAAIAARMKEITDKREATQPVRARTGGSTFKNPPGHIAWQLVEKAGCRGLAKGGARISQQHANFLINEGGATAADIEGLGDEVIARVRALTGVTMEWEIKRIGAPAGHGPRGCSDGAAA